MEVINMEYCGPNAESDPRKIEVSESESVALEKRGLYRRIVQVKKQEAKVGEKQW